MPLARQKWNIVPANLDPPEINMERKLSSERQFSVSASSGCSPQCLLAINRFPKTSEIMLNKTCLFFLFLGVNNLIWPQPNSDRDSLNFQHNTKIFYSVNISKWRRMETREDIAVRKRMPIRVSIFLWNRVSIGNKLQKKLNLHHQWFLKGPGIFKSKEWHKDKEKNI